MKKQTRNLIVLLVALLACFALYAFIKTYNTNAAAKSAEEQAASVITVTALKDIEQLSWNNGTDAFAFTKNSGVWSYSDQAFPLDASYPNAVESTLGDLTAVRKLDQPADSLSAYGLETPAYTVSAVTGGETVTLLIGNASGADYFAKIDGQDAIYTIDSTLVSEISYGLMDMAKLEDFPALSEENINTITLTKGAQTLNLVKEAVTTDSTASATDTATGETSTVSYQWSGMEGSGLSSENTNLSGLLKTLGGLKFLACSAYNVDESAKASYGLNTPTLTLTVTYNDDQGAAKTMTLTVGAADESGDYYAVKDGATTIDTLSADTVTSLTGMFSANAG